MDQSLFQSILVVQPKVNKAAQKLLHNNLTWHEHFMKKLTICAAPKQIFLSTLSLTLSVLARSRNYYDCSPVYPVLIGLYDGNSTFYSLHVFYHPYK